MTRPPGVRLVVAAVLGLAAGGFAWSKVESIPKFLDLKTVRADEPGVWNLSVTARGGGSYDRVDVSSAFGPLEVLGPATVMNLASGRTATFRLRTQPSERPCVVRVNVPGPDSRTYDFAVRDEP